MEHCTRREVKVFIPHICLRSKSGFLIGWRKTTEQQSCYAIAAVLEAPLNSRLIEDEPQRSEYKNEPEVVGFICDIKDSPDIRNDIVRKRKSFVNSEWIIFERVDSKEHRVTLLGCDVEDSLSGDDVLVVVYDGAQVMSSVFLMDDAYCQLSRQDIDEKQNVDIIANSLARYQHLKQSIRKDNSYFIDSLENRPKPLSWILGFMERIIVFLFQRLFSVSTFCGRRLPFHWPYWICNRPALCTQLKRRFDQLRTVVDLHHSSPLQRHRSRNLICLHVFDVFLGILLMTWLLTDQRAEKLSELLMDRAEHVAAYLQNLLQWMMGSPAGLKLNRQLSQLFGKFFTYHIYLWTGYLAVLRPVQVSVLQVMAVSGACGLSVQLALMRDLTSMMTLHIYCFYVYAARLYCLQMYALSSLWRLFRGKKWNVLRQRVDSATFDIDQLFIGTLFFTILLFLLPTTALYYFVFTALRLVVLGIQGALYTAITGINALPAASVAARVIFPNTVSDRVKFTLIPKILGRPLYLAMETQAASAMTIMTSLSKYDVKANGESWGTFVKKLVLGELVYPWIEPTKNKTE